ncbi:MAG: peptide chain release factor 2 [Lentisphaeraceae bacterium]|nr:peptide chain release factor 2 [Lentisphaeraceae bacterium]
MFDRDAIVARLTKLQTSLEEMRAYLKIDERQARLDAAEAKQAEPGFWDNPEAARGVIAEGNAEKAFIYPFNDLTSAIEEGEMALEMADAEAPGEEQDLMAGEAEAALEKAEKLEDKLRLQSLLCGKLDACNAILTLHSGAGGTEACDWASMLYRMYQMYAEDAGFEVEVLDLQPGDEAGIKSVMFVIKGPYAYGYLKAERGVHRLVRISPFDAAKRRHTSFVSLDVVAEISDDVDVEIKEEDLRVDTYRSGGAGGQKVNKTDSAVRLTHLPTGIVVACQVERSQHQNKARAMQVLKAKLYELEMDKKRKEMERFYGDKGEIAWGSQIRSYVFQPYTMVKDHRTGHETANVQGMMDGKYVQGFIEAYLKQRAQDSQ